MDTVENSSWKEGLRIVDLYEIAQQMHCKQCGSVLDLNRIENETNFGLASLLQISCCCGFVNRVHTGKRQKIHTGDEDVPIYEINCKLYINLLHKDTSVTNFLTVLGIPVKSWSSLQNPEELKPLCSTQSRVESKEPCLKKEVIQDFIDVQSENPEVVHSQRHPICLLDKDSNNILQSDSEMVVVSTQAFCDTQRAIGKYVHSQDCQRTQKKAALCDIFFPLQKQNSESQNMATNSKNESEITNYSLLSVQNNNKSTTLYNGEVNLNKNLSQLSSTDLNQPQPLVQEKSTYFMTNSKVAKPSNSLNPKTDLQNQSQQEQCRQSKRLSYNREKVKLLQTESFVTLQSQDLKLFSDLKSPRSTVRTRNSLKMQTTAWTKNNIQKKNLPQLQSMEGQAPWVRKSVSQQEAIMNMCPVCQKCVESSRGLAIHMKRMHNQAECHGSGKTKRKKQKSIAKENLAIDKETDIENHLKEIHKDKPLEFSTQESVDTLPFGQDTLSQVVRKEPVTIDSQKNIYQEKLQQENGELLSLFNCNKCSAQFYRNSQLTRHLQNVHPKKSLHKCRKCAESFASENQLKSHRQMHILSGSQEIHECTICLKTFHNGRRLRAHRTTHTQEERLQPKKRYRCETCGEEFQKNYFFQIHLRYHTGEKPYKCLNCDMSFITKPERRSHFKKCVSKKKAFLCALCGGRFSSTSTLRKHERVHTGEKPHKCRYCERTFGRTNTLKIHERQHTGERPYVCDQCAACFRQRVSLVTHMRNKHSINATLYSQPRDGPRYTHAAYVSGKPPQCNKKFYSSDSDSCSGTVTSISSPLQSLSSSVSTSTSTQSCQIFSPTNMAEVTVPFSCDDPTPLNSKSPSLIYSIDSQPLDPGLHSLMNPVLHSDQPVMISTTMPQITPAAEFNDHENIIILAQAASELARSSTDEQVMPLTHVNISQESAIPEEHLVDLVPASGIIEMSHVSGVMSNGQDEPIVTLHQDGNYVVTMHTAETNIVTIYPNSLSSITETIYYN